MYKKLEEETLVKLLETGIHEFAMNGLDRANINSIAKTAGLSVGVIYKYYENKDAFFLACVRHALGALDAVLEDAFVPGDSVRTTVGRIVSALQQCGREHGDYYVLYNEITSGSCRRYAKELAHEIEERTAKAYSAFFGQLPFDDPKLFAFLFDNTLMMLQFSYGCEYYRERAKIFCGDDCFDDDDSLAELFTDYICRMLGID